MGKFDNVGTGCGGDEVTLDDISEREKQLRKEHPEAFKIIDKGVEQIQKEKDKNKDKK